MYGKIFDSMYDGTISSNWKGLVTFQQMIVLCDADGMLDMTPPALSRRTGIPLEIIEEGIAFLEQTDAHSRSDEEQGRRIVRIDAHRPWGWHLVNHEHYRNLLDSGTVRAQTRERVRKHRASKGAKCNGSVTRSNAQKRYTDTDTNKRLAQFATFWGFYPNRKDKKKANSAFEKLSPDDQQSAINDVQLRATEDHEWTKDGGKFVPMPSTYLNNRRWEDDWKSVRSASGLTLVTGADID